MKVRKVRKVRKVLREMRHDRRNMVFQGSPNVLILAPLSNSAEGKPLTQVPYKGGAPAVQDLMGGQIDIFMTPYGKGQVQLVEEGKLKAPAVLSAERQELFKKVPTLNESTALKGFIFESWAGFFVHKDTPEAMVQALHKALSEVANDASVRATLEGQAMIVPRPLALPALAKLYADNTAKYQAIARSMNLQPQ